MQEISHQIDFPTLEFAENPEPRCPCILLLDTSASMHGAPIRQLKEGLESFWHDLNRDQMARKRAEIAVITFGPVRAALDFATAEGNLNIELTASGDTPMGAAIERGVQILEERKRAYNDNGILYYRPWIFLITDGAPTDNCDNAIRLIHSGERDKHFMFFAVGVENADFDKLRRIAPPTRPPVKLHGLQFKQLFEWLSTSLKRVSNSRTDEQVVLPPPTGWGSTT